MLSYRHAFHAGNHADILKHISLMLVLEAMQKKEKPFTAIDCHAGAGFYYLADERLQKTGEAESGILHLLHQTGRLNDSGCDESVSLNGEGRNGANVAEGRNGAALGAVELSGGNCSGLNGARAGDDAGMELGSVGMVDAAAERNALERYLDFVQKYVERGLYPGSPEIIRSFLRENDKAILMELHNNEIEILKSHISDKRITIQHRNCFEGLNAVTPPQIRRGFLLMDPSYEVDSDWENVASSLIETQKRWNVGIQLLWYPLLKHRKVDLEIMLDKIQNAASLNGFESFTQELIIDSSEKETGLYGSGMLFVNPPWKLQEQLQSAISLVECALKN